jgi:hypothetical protein
MLLPSEMFYIVHIRDISEYKSEDQCEICTGSRWAKLGTRKLLVIGWKGGLKTYQYQHKPPAKGQCEICGRPTSQQKIRRCQACFLAEFIGRNRKRIGSLNPGWKGGREGKGQCETCGAPTSRQDIRRCKTCYNREFGLRSRERSGAASPLWKGGRQGKCEVCGGPTYRKRNRYCRTCYPRLRRVANPRQKGRDRYWKLRKAYRKSDRQKGFKERVISTTKLRLMVQEPCTYCGTIENNRGLDRIDNSRGHVEGNVAVACPLCNVARQNYFSFEDVRDHLGPAIRKIRALRKLTLEKTR